MCMCVCVCVLLDFNVIESFILFSPLFVHTKCVIFFYE